MKALLILILLSTGVCAQTFRILERQDHSTRTQFRKVELRDLVSSDTFDGKYFRVVHGKSNEAISLTDPNDELVLKAANTYHHLTLARDFWKTKIAPERIDSLPKLVVRIEITNLFDDQGHFAHDNRNPQYNNALSIPAGRTPEWIPEERGDAWGPEIWFRPQKKIDMKLFMDNIGPNPLTQTLMAFEDPIFDYARNQFERSLIERVIYPSYASGSVQSDIIRFAGTIAVSKLLLRSSRRLDPLFLEKWYYLDTAMVPEVVYHEYAHVVLSDHLTMSHSTPVIEGMADYFAAVHSNKRRVYAKVPGRSTSSPKDPFNERPYSHWDESNRAASSDFVLSVLWDVRDTLGPEMSDRLIYRARTYLSTETATISDHLLRAILRSCQEVCESPRADKLKLYEVFSKRGF